jgi:hypothetical protein
MHAVHYLVADIGGQLVFYKLAHFLAEGILFGTEVKIHDQVSALDGAMVCGIGAPMKVCIAEHDSIKMQQVRIVAFHVTKVNDR